MAVLNRRAVAAPCLRKETAAVAELNGEVVVRSLPLSARLSIGLDGDAGPYQHIPRILAESVIDDEGEPIFDVAGWEAFGAASPAAALRLFEVAQRVSGLTTEAVEKN